MVLKMVHFHKSSRPQWVNYDLEHKKQIRIVVATGISPSNMIFYGWRTKTVNLIYIMILLGLIVNGYTEAVYKVL